MLEKVWRKGNPLTLLVGMKRLVFIPIPKKGNADNCSNYHTIALISQTSKEMFKILQARLQQYVNHELPDVQGGFRKGRGTRSNCQHLLDHWKSKRVTEKTSTSALLTMSKPLTVWITTNCGKFLKRWEYQTTWPASWEICIQVKKQQLELDMEQHWFQIGKGVGQGCILSPWLFNLYAGYIMQNATGWITSWIQDCQEKYQ